jgi:hypothetical protein
MVAAGVDIITIVVASPRHAFYIFKRVAALFEHMGTQSVYKRELDG